jgi:APA family basic amino acid/polyamine antiporter
VHRTELPRTLSFWHATALVVGITIGSGIFRSPAGVAARVPSPTLFLGLWIAGGVISLCGALSVARLAAALPETGGFYVYLREGWGRLAAFLFGWSELVLIRASALGGIAVAFGDYSLRAFSIDPASHVLTARSLSAIAILFAASVNIRGVKLGATIVGLSTVAKFSALALIAVASFVLGSSHGADVSHLTAAAAGPVTIGSLGLGLVSVLWAYDGFGDVSFAGGEVKEPERNLPRSILAGTTAIVCIYLLVNVAYLYVIPIEVAGRSPLVAADTMRALFGPGGAVLVSVFIAISTFGALNGSTLASPRVFFAMASDGLFFNRIAAVHPRYKTPYVSILLTALLGMALVLSRSFEQLTDTFVIAIWPFYALGVAAIFPLRARLAGSSRATFLAGSMLAPIVFIAAVVAFVGNALVTEPISTSVTFAIILAGIPVYFLAFRSRRK